MASGVLALARSSSCRPGALALLRSERIASRNAGGMILMYAMLGYLNPWTQPIEPADFYTVRQEDDGLPESRFSSYSSIFCGIQKPPTMVSCLLPAAWAVSWNG